MATPLTSRPGYKPPLSLATKREIIRLWDTGQFPCKDRLAKHLGLDWTQISRALEIRHKHEAADPTP